MLPSSSPDRWFALLVLPQQKVAIILDGDRVDDFCPLPFERAAGKICG